MLDTKSDQNESIIKINDSELMKVEIVLRHNYFRMSINTKAARSNQNVWISYSIITID